MPFSESRKEVVNIQMKINLAMLSLFILCISISVYPIGIRDCGPDYDDDDDDNQGPGCASYYGRLRVELMHLDRKIQSLEMNIHQRETMPGKLPIVLKAKMQELADAHVRRDKLLKLLQN